MAGIIRGKGLTVGGGYQPSGEAGRGPDRADAMVWATTELARPAQVPRIRRL
jgi:phage terminase large subunit-like protein